MKNWLNKRYDTRLGRCLLSAALVAALFILIRYTNTITFLNNDDTNILKTLAGYFTGTPYPSHPFINVLLGLAVSSLYSLFPGLAWWPFLQILLLYIGVIAIGACVLKAFRHRNLPLVFPLISIAVFIVLLISYALVWMTFTLTAAVLGSAAVAILLSFGMDERDEAHPALPLIAATLFCCLCFLVRNSSGVSMVPFIALSGLYRLIVMWKRKRGRSALLLCGLSMAALSAALMFVNRAGIEWTNPEGFYEFNSARGRYMDYPHDTYDENPAMYNAIGWDKTLYELAENRFFMDERITAETLRYIADRSNAANRPVSYRLENALRLGLTFTRQNGPLQYMFWPLLGLLLISLLSFFRHRDRWLSLLTCCCFAAGGFLLCLYLCYTGRFLLRTLHLIAYPTTVGMLMMTAEIVEGRCALSADFSFRARKMNLALTVLVTGALLYGLINTVGVLNRNDPMPELRVSRQVKSYVIEHDHEVYVRAVNIGNDVDPYLVYRGADGRPVNLFDWGGTGMHSGYLQKQLQVNDLPAFTPDIFRQDDVFFIASVENDMAKLFETYMVENQGAAGLKEVDRITSTIVVYRVEYPEAP